LSHPPGLCVRHLENGGSRVQAFVKVNGVERHARNCALCRPVLEAEPGSEAAHPGGLCDEGKAMLVRAVKAAQEGAAA